jgi:predicted SprT family Zn-dependent metalloprotease
MNVWAAQKLALSLLAEHKLIEAGWSFYFDRSVRRFGSCQFGRKAITLSRTLTELNDEAEVRDTVLHEIAHALAGPRVGHSYRWRILARSIGARPERCYTSARVNTPEAPHLLRCKGCGATLKRFKRSKAYLDAAAGTGKYWHKQCGREAGTLEVVSV